ncbi:DUF4115 domain-containing protein [Planococcus liqunii]|uniref:helix-turn-helix domain-containing protein n=1 Tax=Planococcus liqunii TaxID=3058394 RepID=UPI0026299BF0|nr:helix-turn-helix domain-containing protein [Planococcus sp. N056]WKA49715.1 DUF4115 domain-containing protein [Planococcus sp. N056]
MSELGTRLKEARIAKGLSLEDLQEATKIQKRYLAGIEEGDFSMMPGPFYSRAFIKQYAEAVGLHPDELFEQYNEEIPAIKEDPYTPPTPSRRQTFASQSSSRTNEIMPKVIAALFIVTVLAVVVFFYSNLDTNDPIEEGTANDSGVPYEEPAEEAPAEPAEKPAEEKAEKPAEAPKKEEPKEPKASIKAGKPAGQTTTYDFSGPAKRELVIKVVGGPSWVQAADSNQKELFKPDTMAAGATEKLDVSGLKQVQLRLGKAANVQLAVNGVPVEYKLDATTQNIVIRFAEAE